MRTYNNTAKVTIIGEYSKNTLNTTIDKRFLRLTKLIKIFRLRDRVLSFNIEFDY